MSPAKIHRMLVTNRYRRDTGRPATKRGTLSRRRSPCVFSLLGGRRPGVSGGGPGSPLGRDGGGGYLHTLNAVDTATLGCEPVAMVNRSQGAVRKVIHGIRERLPFPPWGIDSDNDSASLNTLLSSLHVLPGEGGPVHPLAAVHEERPGVLRGEAQGCRAPAGRVLAVRVAGPAGSLGHDLHQLAGGGELLSAGMKTHITTLNPVLLQRRIEENLRAVARLPRNITYETSRSGHARGDPTRRKRRTATLLGERRLTGPAVGVRFPRRVWPALTPCGGGIA